MVEGSEEVGVGEDLARDASWVVRLLLLVLQWGVDGFPLLGSAGGTW